MLTQLQNQKDMAWVPGIWPHEMLNALGMGINRGRIARRKGFELWQEIRALPIRVVEFPVDEALLEVALEQPRGL